MTDSDIFNVLIVGAGPTGLTAAIELARMGASVRIIDKRTEASGFSRAVGILPESLRLLEPSGVAKRLMLDGQKMSEVRVFFDQRPVFHLPLTSGCSDHEFLLGLAQDRTEAIMRECLYSMGIEVEFGLEFRSLEQTENCVIAKLGDGNESVSQYLIGADGIHSTVRESIGIDYPGFELPETWSIADVETKDWAHPQAFVICRLEGGRVAVVVQLEASRYRVISNTEDALATLSLPINVTNIHRQGTFRISVRQVDRYQKGLTFLAGDAAHCHSPVGGRGMNLGIADACELAGRIIKGTVDGYSTSRHSAGYDVIGLSERARKLVTSGSAFSTMVLRALFFAGSKSSRIRRRMRHAILYD